MPRYLIAVAAGCLLATAVALEIWAPDEPLWQQGVAFCTRLGAIAFLCWLAWHDLHRLPVWLLAAIPVVAIVLARWPRLFFLLIPALILIGFLRRPLTVTKRRSPQG